MKALLVVYIVILCTAFVACDKTQKQSNTTHSPDTIVVKKDTAISKTDTMGFNK